jgi:signal transduction histidine kinase
MRPLAIRDVVTRAVSMVEPLAVKKQLTIQVEMAETIGEMVSDRRRLEQILINLLNNAIKFTERGGIRLRCERRDQNVTFAVIDTGIGIKPEHRDILFKPFRQVETGLTRHHEGTGLGLAICDRLVKLLGGQLRVESVWQEGSTFSFTVPAQPNAKP